MLQKQASIKGHTWRSLSKPMGHGNGWKELKPFPRVMTSIQPPSNQRLQNIYQLGCGLRVKKNCDQQLLYVTGQGSQSAVKITNPKYTRKHTNY